MWDGSRSLMSCGGGYLIATCAFTFVVGLLPSSQAPRSSLTSWIQEWVLFSFWFFCLFVLFLIQGLVYPKLTLNSLWPTMTVNSWFLYLYFSSATTLGSWAAGSKPRAFFMLGKQSAPWASALLWSFLRLLSEWALLCECWEEAHLWSLRSLWELELAHEFYALFSSSTEKKQQKTVDSGTCSLSPKVVPRYTELCPLQTVEWLTNLPPQVLLGITLPLLRNDGTVRPQHDLRLSLP